MFRAFGVPIGPAEADTRTGTRPLGPYTCPLGAAILRFTQSGF